MAGFVGFLPSAGRSSEVAEQMFASLHHNEKSQGATLQSESPSATVIAFSGRNWLSQSKDKAISLLLLGELFPYPTNLADMYEELGHRFYEKLNGRFRGVVLDRRESKITLFNDRYGLGRIYYAEDTTGFYFATEAKALLKVLPKARSLDARGLGEWISCGCVLQDRTLFTGVSIMPPASRWVFGAESITRGSYFNRETWEEQEVLSNEQYYRKLRDTFADVLPFYLSADEKLGMSLTGGLDGRMIMAWANKEPGALPCYTFGGSYRECADVTLARKVARVCGQPHSVLPIGEEFLREFPKLAAETISVTDGGLDVTGAVETYANKKASAIAPTRLTGSYGSEVLRGNIAFKPQGVSEKLFAPEMVESAKTAAATYHEEVATKRPSFIAFKQLPWHHYARLAAEESQIAVRTPFIDNALVALSFRAPVASYRSAEPSLRLIKEGNVALARIPTDRGLRFPETMATRLGHHWQQITFKAEYAYDYGMPQWLAAADHFLAPLHLERLFLGRHKFYHFRTWYRKQLASYVKEILLDSRTRARPYFQSAQLERLVNGHLSGRWNYTNEITQALSLELLARQVIDSN